jgi:hypothetical protein
MISREEGKILSDIINRILKHGLSAEALTLAVEIAYEEGKRRGRELSKSGSRSDFDSESQS